MALVPAQVLADGSASAYQEPDHVLLPKQPQPGGYGTPKLKVTERAGVTEVLLGGPGRWFIDHGFAIRATGYGLVTATHDVPAAPSSTVRAPFQFGYGGPRFGYVFRPHDVVHFNVGFVVGAGGFALVMPSYATTYRGAHDGHHFFAFEPQAELEANMMRYTRVALGLSYRYIGMSYVPGVEPGDLGGTAASILVKLGDF